MSGKTKTADFHQRLRRTIAKYKMLAPGDKVLVALSGGPDSTALFLGLEALAPELRLRLVVFHLNHKLRPESDAEAEFVRDFAAARGVEAVIKEADVAGYLRKHKVSPAAAARRLRYRLMRTAAAELGADKIALGHQADDAVETLLLRLLAGSGPSGLLSIPPVREGYIIRPLIETTRARIEAYLRALDVDYVVDASNFSDKYRRNRLRRLLPPALAEYDGDYQKNILKAAELLRDDQDYLYRQAVIAYERLAARQGPEISFSRAALRNLGPALGGRVLRRAAVELAAAAGGVSAVKFKDLWTAVTGADFKQFDFAAGIRVCQADDRVLLFLGNKKFIAEQELSIGRTVDVSDEYALKLESAPVSAFTGGGQAETAFLDADAVKWPLRVRAWRPGDAFTPLGMTGRKKLHDFFIDAKVPRRRRRRIPLVVDEAGIVWVAGLRPAERTKVTSRTKKLAVIRLLKREYING